MSGDVESPLLGSVKSPLLDTESIAIFLEGMDNTLDTVDAPVPTCPVIWT